MAGELGVNHKTVRAAVRQLEEEGVLVGQGPGRERLIVIPRGEVSPMRVAVLSRSRESREDVNLSKCMQALAEEGHTPFFAGKSQQDLKGKGSRISSLVNQTEADAWLVNGGSREVLEWFSKQPIPSFALFGRRSGLPLAAVGPDKKAAYAEVGRHLADLGHRRIVLLCSEDRRVPGPGATEQAFLDALESRGIQTGAAYNLPDWEDSSEGLDQILTSLFQVTPPTALLIDMSNVFNAAYQILLRRGIRVPQNVSLISTDWDVLFELFEPSVAHIDWDLRPVVRRVAQWANNVSRGRRDVRQSLTPAKYVEGGTVEAVPGG